MKFFSGNCLGTSMIFVRTANSPPQMTSNSEVEPSTIPDIIPYTIGLSGKQLEVLAIIQDDLRISIRKMAKKLGLNNSTVVEHINSIKGKGVLERVGGTHGYWKVNVNIPD
jgi:ATP-dependent DNA helicase RecG